MLESPSAKEQKHYLSRGKASSSGSRSFPETGNGEKPSQPPKSRDQLEKIVILFGEKIWNNFV